MGVYVCVRRNRRIPNWILPGRAQQEPNKKRCVVVDRRRERSANVARLRRRNTRSALLEYAPSTVLHEPPTMTVWVVRKSLTGDTVEGPRLCARPGRIVREPGLLSLDELFAQFLREGEAAEDVDGHGRWKIVRGSQLAGFFEVVDPTPVPTSRNSSSSSK